MTSVYLPSEEEMKQKADARVWVDLLADLQALPRFSVTFGGQPVCPDALSRDKVLAVVQAACVKWIKNNE